MGTNKLGLKIVRISQGYTEPLEVNGGGWTKYVRDVREDLKCIENFHGNTSILMLTCTDDGNLLTIVSLIEGRPTDCISAWIYVPDDLIIPGKKLVEVIEITRNQISANACDYEILRSEFDKPYEVAPAKRMSHRAVGDKYAYRYYGIGSDYQLWELLESIDQRYYQQYKSVFLMDKSTMLICSAGDDLSSQTLSKSILAPVPKEVEGFIPYIDGAEFSSPRYVVKGESIKITWRRKEYNPIPTITKVEEGFNYVVPTRDQYRRKIPFAAIVVTDEMNRRIENYTLRINLQELKAGGYASVSEDALTDVRIEVWADGYKSKNTTADFTKTRQFGVELSKNTFAYKLAIPLKGDGYLDLEEYETSDILRESPIEGYVADADGGRFSRGKKNYLRYSPYDKAFWIKSAIILLVTLIVGICIGAWAWNKINDVEALKDENNSLQEKLDNFKSVRPHHNQEQEKATANPEGKQSRESGVIPDLEENEALDNAQTSGQQTPKNKDNNARKAKEEDKVEDRNAGKGDQGDW